MDDPFALARARLAARLARERSPRPDLPQLDELLAEVAELQPLPAVATKILQLGENQQFSAHELATIIASDQVLTARLLRLANSAYYGAARRIGTVRDAVVLLGFRTVQQVALASCLVGNPRPLANLEYLEFWQFSIATGLLSEILARTEGRHQDAAFTAGVIHNIGLLTLDQQRPQVLTEVLTRARQQHETLQQAERGLLGYTDADLGGALTLHWNFPEGLAEAVRCHASLDAPPPAGFARRARHAGEDLRALLWALGRAPRAAGPHARRRVGRVAVHVLARTRGRHGSHPGARRRVHRRDARVAARRDSLRQLAAHLPSSARPWQARFRAR